MKIREIINVLEAEIVTGSENMDTEINSACGADLMSDVMAYVKENVILLTGLVNPQVVRTAEMMDINVIAFVRGKKPEENIINLAREMGMTILTTKHPMFIACGKLYSAGITGRGVWD
ncbi:DRTGG domain-containing protein [Herbivorax sp. ANBcel31]|uniref:DRTGG domain-containing protein n=1 Tax=Herbivorax sp. ANBcel31 TaxID=3069754 RepID=UPI0027AE6F8D|nr:DRTGG domain-containing protein [Herbivorax sp. ANBcel31]MDQ2085460.1 DRTGG domain-containing protein [Herbivorax sp. ANBcel31]